jgi:hypothetical protein
MKEQSLVRQASNQNLPPNNGFDDQKPFCKKVSAVMTSKNFLLRYFLLPYFLAFLRVSSRFTKLDSGFSESGGMARRAIIGWRYHPQAVDLGFLTLYNSKNSLYNEFMEIFDRMTILKFLGFHLAGFPQGTGGMVVEDRKGERRTYG